jgi:hypothetical protein
LPAHAGGAQLLITHIPVGGMVHCALAVSNVQLTAGGPASADPLLDPELLLLLDPELLPDPELLVDDPELLLDPELLPLPLLEVSSPPSDPPELLLLQPPVHSAKLPAPRTPATTKERLTTVFMALSP